MIDYLKWKVQLMCGRYFRKSDKQKIAEVFHLGSLPDAFVLSENYNVAPRTFGLTDVLYQLYRPQLVLTIGRPDHDEMRRHWLLTIAV